jgi:hypothetical protein
MLLLKEFVETFLQEITSLSVKFLEVLSLPIVVSSQVAITDQYTFSCNRNTFAKAFFGICFQFHDFSFTHDDDYKTKQKLVKRRK